MSATASDYPTNLTRRTFKSKEVVANPWCAFADIAARFRICTEWFRTEEEALDALEDKIAAVLG